MTEQQTATQQVVFGLDLGSTHIVLARATEPKDIELVPNELGALSTPFVVSLGPKKRDIGESGVAKLRIDPNITISEITPLIGTPLSELEQGPAERFASYSVKLSANSNGDVVASFGDKEIEIDQLVAMLLTKLSQDADRAVGASTGLRQLVIAVPSSFTESQVGRVLDAAKIAGLWDCKVIPTSSAHAVYYTSKHPSFTGPIAIVDMGSHFTTVLTIEAGEDGNIRVVGSATSNHLGSRDIDAAIFHRFESLCFQKHSQHVAVASRAGKRLLAASERMKKLLSSGVGEAKVDVENICSDTDMSFTMSKSEFEQVCQPVCDQLEALVRSVAGVDRCTHVELVGGGCRVLPVQDALRRVFGDSALRFTMDASSAVAIGAAGFGVGDAQRWASLPVYPATATASDNAIAAKRDTELRLREADAHEELIAHHRNDLERAILEMRNALSGKYKALLDSAAISPVLNQAEEWLFGEDAENASAADIETRLTNLRSQLKQLAPQYFEAVENHRKQVEEELNKAAEEAKADAAAAGEQDDHDFRKLKKSDRMNLVMKNKAEGTELFTHGNIEMAAMRYIKALTHTEKFFDLSEDDKKEVLDVQLSLHLNLAMCYLKLEQYSKVVTKCESALAIDPKNVKALFRRGQAHLALRNLDAALSDARVAAELEPNDKGVANFLTKVKAEQKRQLDKEKAVYGKMFA